ncbi:MAG: response regulator [Oscillospiraceae bacterium]|jgi:two-component system response regulator YesN|nr:response regulator [Oscillospiraceae bacterium]
MISTMIVDDEVYVRLGLTSMIDWEKLGFTIVGQAANGQIALDMAEEIRPQLIITDVRMPVMDGLTFVRRLRDRGQAAKIIVLSLYEDFYKLRDASRLGIFDYVLKSEIMEAECLIDILTRVKKEIEQGRAGRTLHDRRALETQLVFEIARGCEPDGAALQTALSNLWLSGYAKQQLLLFSLDSYRMRFASGDADQTERDVLMRTVRYLAEENARKRTACVTGHVGENEFLCALFGDREDELTARAGAFVAEFSAELTRLSGYRIFEARARVDSCERLCDCYRAARVLLANRLFFSGRRAVCEADLRERRRFFLSVTKTSLRLSRACEACDEAEVTRIIEEIVMRDIQGLFDREAADNACLELFAVVKDIVDRSGAAGPESGMRSLDILRCDTLRQRCDFLIERLRLSMGKRVDGGELRGRVLRYFHENYQNAVSLQDIADYLRMSPAYISHVYKKLSGESLIETLTRIRMEEAKRLLRTSGRPLRIYEIAERVGMENARYFSQRFKVMVGCTPAEYRTAGGALEDTPLSEAPPPDRPGEG